MVVYTGRPGAGCGPDRRGRSRYREAGTPRGKKSRVAAKKPMPDGEAKSDGQADGKPSKPASKPAAARRGQAGCRGEAARAAADKPAPKPRQAEATQAKPARLSAPRRRIQARLGNQACPTAQFGVFVLVCLTFPMRR
jgi:D-alanyl-D-alanine carboxypeptidase